MIPDPDASLNSTMTSSNTLLTLLGAVTEHGETEVLECGDSFTGEVTVRFLTYLQKMIGEKLIVLLDKATYFTAEAVKNFAAEEPIELVYFPIGSPDLNPTEEYWRQLKLTLEISISPRLRNSDQQCGQHSKRSHLLESINTSVHEYRTARTGCTPI